MAKTLLSIEKDDILQNELPAINSAFWGNFTTWS